MQAQPQSICLLPSPICLQTRSGDGFGNRLWYVQLLWVAAQYLPRSHPVWGAVGPQRTFCSLPQTGGPRRFREVRMTELRLSCDDRTVSKNPSMFCASATACLTCAPREAAKSCVAPVTMPMPQSARGTMSRWELGGSSCTVVRCQPCPSGCGSVGSALSLNDRRVGGSNPDTDCLHIAARHWTLKQWFTTGGASGPTFVFLSWSCNPNLFHNSQIYSTKIKMLAYF